MYEQARCPYCGAFMGTEEYQLSPNKHHGVVTMERPACNNLRCPQKKNRCDCGEEISKEAFMCDDCYMTMKGIYPGLQTSNQKVN